MIHLDCPHCGHGMELDEGFLGGVCRCSECGTMITVPKELGGELKAVQLSKPKATYTSSSRATATDELTRALTGTSVLRASGTIETTKNNKPLVIGGIIAGVLFVLLVIGAMLTSGGGEHTAPDRVELSRSQQDHERIRQGLPTLDDLKFELKGAPDTVIQKFYDDKLSLNQARVIWRQQQEGTPEPAPPTPTVTAVTPTPSPTPAPTVPPPAPAPTPTTPTPAALTFDEIILPTEAGYTPNTFDAELVTFDLSKQLNVDVLYNGYGASSDKTQDGIDTGGSSYVSMSIAGYYRGAEGLGVPNNGLFSRNADHPNIQLALNDSDNGVNAVRMDHNASLSIDAQNKIYHHVHLLAVSGSGVAQVEAILAYESGPEQRITLTIDDWFSDTRPDQGGGPVTPPDKDAFLYFLINGMDRSKGATGFDNVNDAAIFGYRLVTDTTRRLTRITIQRRDQNESLLTLMGATGEMHVGGTMNVVLSPWQSIGPFEANDMGAAFDTEYGPEKDRAMGRIDKEYDGQKWTPRDWVDEKSHEFDFERRDNFAVYLYRTVNAPAAGRLDLSVGSDDSISIWGNGERYWHHNVGRGLDEARDHVTVPVQKGINHLLMKICQGSGGSGFYFKIDRAVANAVPDKERIEKPAAKPQLVAHWPLDGNAVESVSGQASAVLGAVTFVEGRSGQAAQFKADGEIRAEPQAAWTLQQTDFSISMWIRHKDGVPEERWAPLFLKGPFGLWSSKWKGRSFFRWEFKLEESRKTGFETKQERWFDGEWHHVVATRSRQTLTLWIDGKNLGSQNFAWDASDDRNAPLHIGSHKGEEWSQSDGMIIDEVRLYRGILPEETIAELGTRQIEPVAPVAPVATAPKPETVDPNELYREALRLQTDLQKAEQRYRIQLRDKIPPPIEAIQARYLRVTRKNKTGVLHLAEVQVFDLSDMNIAPTGAAKQSSTEQGGVASRAIDGNTDGIWENKSMTHTKSEKEPWWELDLKRTTPVLKIMIWNRSNADPERLDGATVELLDENRQVVWEKTTDKPRPSATFILPRPPANADEYVTDEKLKVMREQVDAAKRRWIEAKRKAGS